MSTEDSLTNPQRSFEAANVTRRNSVLRRLAVAGAVVLACGIAFSAERVWSNLLVGTFYLLTIALGGALFVALTYVSGGGWHVAFRRIPEAMAAVLPVAGVAMLVVLGVRMSRYGWHHDWHGDVGTFWFKELWLTPSFWAVRAVAYVSLWSLLAGWLVARSRKQDRTGDASITGGNVRISALFLAVYAVTFSLASADWMMALEPMWFSTMWGVYNFAGMIQAALAVVIVLGLILRSNGGPLQGVFNDEHLHDLGKLLLGFSCFWMYIWFSQYMLIWYSNIPEETSYFITRTHGPWGPIVVGCIVLNWVIPFFVLLPKPAKRSSGIMMKVAIVVLIGRWVDLYVMVFPSTLGENPVFGIWEAASISCLIGTAGLLLFRSFANAGSVPRHDPFLPESLHYHTC
ncbi:MAG: hypothetical protein H8E66_16455 [Planctomycetes bacterium]|nr:hypothetical protein [Planctomycetota bacterium]